MILCKRFFLVIFIVQLFGCAVIEKTAGSYLKAAKDLLSPPVETKVLKPAELNLGGIEKIALINLKGTSGEKARSILIDRLETANRFNIINRADLNDAIKEIAFHGSGAVDKKAAKRLGKMYGVDALIVGSLSTKFRQESSSSSYKDKEGRNHTRYTKKGVASTTGSLGLINLETGEFLAFQDIQIQKVDSNSSTNSRPEDIDRHTLELSSLNEGTMTFVKKISPYYETVKLRFEKAETPDGKRGVKFIKSGLWEEGVELLIKESKTAPENSNSWYNLGLAFESQNRFIEARGAFKKCLLLEDKKRYEDALRNLLLREKDYKKVKQQFVSSNMDI